MSSLLPKPHPLPSYSTLLPTQKRSRESKTGQVPTAGAEQGARSRGDHGRQAAHGTRCPQTRPHTKRRLCAAPDSRAAQTMPRRLFTVSRTFRIIKGNVTR